MTIAQDAINTLNSGITLIQEQLDTQNRAANDIHAAISDLNNQITLQGNSLSPAQTKIASLTQQIADMNAAVEYLQNLPSQ
jgi:peptidoglycan hydrolase CwlO-like protein